MQETRAKVDEAVGEGWPVGPAIPACSMIAGATQKHGTTELLSHCFRRQLAHAAKAQGASDPPGSGGKLEAADTDSIRG